MHVRVCPECDSEYMPRIELCSDCGTALVDRMEPETEDGGRGSAAAASERGSLPPGEYLPLVQRDTSAQLVPLAERLIAADIPYRVDVRPGYGFELRVRREEHEAALSALADLLDVGDRAPQEIDGEHAHYAQCPACESDLPPAARECPDCGLLLGSDAPTCDSCSTELDPATLRCPRCEGAAGE